MVTRKCVICGGTKIVFKWPQNPDQANSWTEIVLTYNPNIRLKKSSGVCFTHFEKEDFSNYEDYAKGKSQGKDVRLRYHSWALPNRYSATTCKNSSSKKRKLDMAMPSTSVVEEHLFESPSTSNVKRQGATELRSSQEEEPTLADTDYDPNKSFWSIVRMMKKRKTSLRKASTYHSTAILCMTRTDLGRKPNLLFHGLFSSGPWLAADFAEKKNIKVGGTQEGVALTVTIACGACGKQYSKTTSERKQRISTLNYLVSCAILFTGSSASKVFRVFQIIGLRVISHRTFLDHQRSYLNKVVADVWSKNQQNVLTASKQSENLTIAGDARCDSMGHSAKYGSYSIIDVNQSKILAVALVQTEGNSNAMEVIGFKHSMDMMLNQWKLPLKNFISDRPIQIRKIMREQYGPNRKDSSQPLVHHYLDPWHVAKSLKRDLAKMGKSDASNLICKWSPAIINHMYWVAASTSPADYPNNYGDVVEAKWTSLDNHIANKHKHGNPLYPKCAHPTRRRGDKKKKYFKSGAPEYELLSDAITDNKRIKDIRQLSPLGETSSLESYHSIVNQFAPKMIHFGYRAMNSRIKLAAIHFNSRKQEINRGLQIVYPKHKKGEPTVKKVSAPANYDYIDELLHKAYEMERDGCTDQIPGPMVDLYAKPENPDLLKERYTTRFRKDRAS